MSCWASRVGFAELCAPSTVPLWVCQMHCWLRIFGYFLCSRGWRWTLRKPPLLKYPFAWFLPTQGHATNCWLGHPCRASQWKIVWFFANFGRWKTVKICWKCRWNIFKRPERGSKCFGHVSDRFSDPFSRFSNRFSYHFKKLFGGSFVLQACRPNKLGHKQFCSNP